MLEVSTSILSIQKGKELETILNLEKAKTDYFHIDVMDGQFVEKKTYNKMMELSHYIKRVSNLPMDVHLMVKNVKKAIEDFLPIEPNIITFHLEACESEEKIYKFLPYIHIVLVMTVEPGKGGQTLIPDTIKKIENLKKYINSNNLETQIEADGGINLATMENVKKAGADILVSGTAILVAKDYKVIIDELKKN